MLLLKRLLALCLLLCASAAQAQATFPADQFSLPSCIHKSTWTPFGTGTDWKYGTEAPVLPTGVRVSWWAWWCPKPDGTWTPYVFRCVEGRTCLSAWQVTQELDTAMRSADRLVSLRAIITKYQTPVLTNELNDWAYAGDVARLAILPLKPAAPLPPAPGIYVVTGSQAFPLKPDGTRSTTPIATAPTKGETCDCTGANRILQFGATFCKAPSLSTVQTIVAGCSLKKP